MKKLKIALLGLLMSTSVFAQTASTGKNDKDAKSPEDRAKFQTEKMAAELQLSDSQKEQVYTINLGIAQKNEGIRTSTFSEEEKKNIIKSNNQARIEMLKNVLTAAQFEKLKAEMAAHEGMKDHPQGGKEVHEKH
ncbi:MAG: hypothetical protein RLZZ301_1139 [Bacteroidota bacterium]|jgi:hypothetical protein